MKTARHMGLRRVTHHCGMARMNEACPVLMRCVAYDGGISREGKGGDLHTMHGACHILLRHVTYESVSICSLDIKCMHVHTCMHACMHTAHTNMQTHVHSNKLTSKHLYLHAYTLPYIQTCTHIYTCTYGERKKRSGARMQLFCDSAHTQKHPHTKKNLHK